MKKLFKINNQTFSIVFLIILCFFMIKYNIIIGLFIYPFLLFFLIKKLNFIKIFFLFTLIGFLYFFIIYFYGFGNIDFEKINSINKFLGIFKVIGIEIFLKASLLSSIVFGFSGLFSSFLYHKYFKKNYYYLNYLIFPFLFLIFKYICFQFLFGASYLLEVSIVFPSLLSYINLTFQHFIVLVFSIIFFDNLINKKYYILILSSLFILIFFILNFYFSSLSFNYFDNKKVKIAMIQHNSFQSNDKKIISYDEQLKYIIKYTKEASNNGAKVIVWPESTYYNIYQSKFIKIKDSLNNLSKELDVVIIFGAVWIIDGKKRSIFFSFCNGSRKMNIRSI